MSAEIDPLWKQIWKTEGIRWLGPLGNGHADAMERFQHGFELGYEEARKAFVSALNNQLDNEMMKFHHAKANILMDLVEKLLKGKGGAK